MTDEKPTPTVPPSDRRVSVNVYDPGGHRLVRCIRYWSADDPTDIQWERNTVGRKTMLADDDRGVLTFSCKACRDRRADYWFEVRVDAIRRRLDHLWRQPHDRPRSARITSDPIAPLD